MILIDIETFENNENVMEDLSNCTKDLEPVIAEKDTNSNESGKKLNKTKNSVSVSDQNKEHDSKESDKKDAVVVGSESVDKNEEESKEKNDKTEETKTVENSKVEDKSNISEQEVSKSATEETPALETRSSPLSAGKYHKINGEEIKGESMAKEGRRKRRISSVQGRASSVEKTERANKRKRSKSDEDKFCWRCHKESVDSHCTACPRSWHRRCMGGGPQPSSQNWICGECATILKAENAETRSPAMAQLSVEQLCTLLKHVVGRMRDCQGSEPFWKAVDLNEVPNYLDYVVKPMDLSLLESNVRGKLYGSTEAFMADAKWIQHNCIVFNTCGGVYADTSKLTNAARQIIKAARQEVSEIEACPDCYGHARNLPRPQPSWFIEPCRRPHPLVWAKLKGFPFWPAKAMSRVNGQGHVDVRFFGAHDRAWVPPRDLYLYSENPPAPLPRKRKSDMDECVREITRHCRKLELTFGQFKFAPPKVQYNPRDPSQIKLMLPHYNPLQPSSNYIVSVNTSQRKKAPLRKRSVVKKKSLGTKESPTNTSDDANDSANQKEDSGSDCEKYIEISRIPKVRSSEKVSNDRVDSPVPANSSDERKKANNYKKRRYSIASSNFEDSLKTDDEAQSQNLKSFNKSSDCQSSSDNELSLETRQLMRSAASGGGGGVGVGVLSNKDDATVEKKSKSSHISLQNETTPHQDVKTKAKSNPKSNRNQVRVYKPKTRMVNQVIAERAKATSISNEQHDSIEAVDNPAGPREDKSVVSLAATGSKSTKNDSATSLSGIIVADPLSVVPSASTNPVANLAVNDVNSTPRTSIVDPLRVISEAGSRVGTSADSRMASILLIKNAGSISPKRVKSVKDGLSLGEAVTAPTVIKQEPKEHLQHLTPHKKESKARKSFLNRPPVFPQIPTPSPPKAPASPPDAMVYIPGNRTENESDYLLLPPEAGPLSAQLYRGSHELARQMAEFMEEALTEAAQLNSRQPDGSEVNQRAIIHHLKLQIERMRWQHQQRLVELKHNTDLTLREMKASLEAEKYRAVEETKREAEEEKLRSIEETKRKQWCALCGNEALFYCCWNTAYCDYPCQQAHWSTHMRTCAQNLPPNTIIPATASVNQQQVMPRLVIPSPHASSNMWGA